MSGNEGDFAATVDPHGILLRVCRAGNAARLGAIEVHHIEFVVALVLLNTFVSDAEEHFFAVGRHLGIRHSAKSLESVNVKHAVGIGFEIRFLNHAFMITATGGQGNQRCRRHGQKSFVHVDMRLIFI